MLPEAILCLALNVYHEARGEPRQGQMAVALATRNRAIQEGTGICWVVFRHAQFSWTLDSRKMQKLPPKGRAWDTAVAVATKVALFDAEDFTNGATFYHKTTMRPCWAPAMERVGRWGAHIFYRKPPKMVYNGRSLCKQKTP